MWDKRHIISLAVLLSASLVVNIALTVENARHRRAARTRFQAGAFLREGSIAPPFRAKRLDGSETTITATDVDYPTVFYAFTPQCHWCTVNLDNIVALIRGTEGRMRFVGVSLSQRELRKYLTQADLPFSATLVEPTEDTIVKFQLYGTPRTIVVNPDSTVARIWNGAFSESAAPDVATFFQVKLPGLRTSSDRQAAR